MNWKEIGLRFVWTIVAAVMGAFGAVEMVDMAVTNAALMAGIVAALSFIVNLTKEILSITSSDSWLARVGLTFVQASAAALISVQAFNISSFKAAAMVGFIAAANVLTLTGRQYAAPKPIK